VDELSARLDKQDDYLQDLHKMVREMCAQGNSNIAALKLRIPDLLLVDNTGVGTPPTPSVISTTSTSSNFHIDRLTMEESPGPQIMGPPIAGPSGQGRDPPQAQGTCFSTPLTFPGC
jgi:hypothetical protein